MISASRSNGMSFVIAPIAKDIYSWSNFTPLGRVKVVIIGQDPYHGARQAHGRASSSCIALSSTLLTQLRSVTGLSFSVPTGVPVPPSLRNVRILLISLLSNNTELTSGDGLQRRYTPRSRRSFRSLSLQIMGASW